MNEYAEWFEPIIRMLKSFLPVGLLSWIGGTAKYLHDLKTGKQEHNWRSYLISSGVSVLTGIIVGLFIPQTEGFYIRDGLIALSGVCAFQVITVLEDMGVGVIKRFISRGK